MDWQLSGSGKADAANNQATVAHDRKNIMTRPNTIFVTMVAFIIAIALGAAALREPLQGAFVSNTGFNAVIVAVFLIGIIVNLLQVAGLNREMDWIETYRRSNREQRPSVKPKLLASVARMLAGKGELRLSALSMRTMLDSIRTRLDESRELSRYLIGLLIFLGLLGTFWGLLRTVSSVAGVIGALQVDGADGASMFAALQQSLQQPLNGMSVAFSSSLFGLAGSLVLGFLDLQAAHAQNRFVNELEEWLAGSARLSSGILPEDAESGAPAYVQALLEQTADAMEKLQREVSASTSERQALADQQQDLAKALHELSRNISQSQASSDRLEQVLATVTSEAAQPFSDELRNELRLLNRTIANALTPRTDS